MPSNEERRHKIEQEILADLQQIETLEELRDLIGEITPEEQALLDSIDYSSFAYLEEGDLPEGFIERIIERTMSRLPDRQDTDT